MKTFKCVIKPGSSLSFSAVSTISKYIDILAYVSALRAAGVKADVDVYPTDMHAFDMLTPNSALSRQAIAAFERHFAAALQNETETRESK